MVVPPKHPKMIVFCRKTPVNPPFSETPISQDVRPTDSLRDQLARLHGADVWITRTSTRLTTSRKWWKNPSAFRGRGGASQRGQRWKGTIGTYNLPSFFQGCWRSKFVPVISLSDILLKKSCTSWYGESSTSLKGFYTHSRWLAGFLNHQQSIVNGRKSISSGFPCISFTLLIGGFGHPIRTGYLRIVQEVSKWLVSGL